MECEVLIHNCSVTVPKGNQCQVGSKYGHPLLFRGNRCSALVIAREFLNALLLDP